MFSFHRGSIPAAHARLLSVDVWYASVDPRGGEVSYHPRNLKDTYTRTQDTLKQKKLCASLKRGRLLCCHTFSREMACSQSIPKL